MAEERILDSCVRFWIVSDLTGEEYKVYVKKLMLDFLFWAGAKEKHKEWLSGQIAEALWNQEYPLDIFTVKGREIDHIKLYLYDDVGKYGDRGGESDYFRQQICFRDHYSLRDVEKIQWLADAFETFLKENGVQYSRDNQTISAH